jgi:hypothetical protein
MSKPPRPSEFGWDGWPGYTDGSRSTVVLWGCTTASMFESSNRQIVDLQVSELRECATSNGSIRLTGLHPKCGLRLDENEKVSGATRFLLLVVLKN